MQARAMMQEAVITTTPDMSLGHAQRLMREQHIRHLPVVSGKRLIGIVTDRDIRAAAPSPATTLSRGEMAYLRTCRICTTGKTMCTQQRLRRRSGTVP